MIADRPGVAGLSTARELGIEARDSLLGKGRTAERHSNGRWAKGSMREAPATRGARRFHAHPFAASFCRAVRRTDAQHSSVASPEIHRALHTHRRALEAKDAEHGASVHFVTAAEPRWRTGRSAVESTRCTPRDTEADLSARVQATGAHHLSAGGRDGGRRAALRGMKAGCASMANSSTYALSGETGCECRTRVTRAPSSVPGVRSSH